MSFVNWLNKIYYFCTNFYVMKPSKEAERIVKVANEKLASIRESRENNNSDNSNKSRASYTTAIRGSF